MIWWDIQFWLDLYFLKLLCLSIIDNQCTLTRNTTELTCTLISDFWEVFSCPKSRFWLQIVKDLDKIWNFGTVSYDWSSINWLLNLNEKGDLFWMWKWHSLSFQVLGSLLLIRLHSITVGILTTTLMLCPYFVHWSRSKFPSHPSLCRKSE